MMQLQDDFGCAPCPSPRLGTITLQPTRRGSPSGSNKIFKACSPNRGPRRALWLALTSPYRPQSIEITLVCEDCLRCAWAIARGGLCTTHKPAFAPQNRAPRTMPA